MSDKVMRYSEAFKLQVVDELSRGLYGSPFAATRAYGIGSVGTVRRWLVQYGKAELLKKVVRVEKRGEATELRRLKERVSRLEASLADAHMDGALDRAFLEILCERTDTDVGAFKKKHAGTVSSTLGPQSARSRA